MPVIKKTGAKKFVFPPQEELGRELLVQVISSKYWFITRRH